MRARLILGIVAGLALLAGVLVAARGVGQLPALGPLFDPVHGIWALAVDADLPDSANAAIPNLSAMVQVKYDQRGVPHIFAPNEPDAYRALGYVVARDRLFQLELQTRAASGRLTELVGPSALPLDQQARRIGLPRAAEQKFAAMAQDSRDRRILDAYAAGVNAYIDALRPKDYPIEYRLLGARPMRWEPINSIHLLNRMGFTLAFVLGEQSRLRAQEMVGRTAADALFPINSLIQEPIQPNGGAAPRFDFAPIPPPGRPDSSVFTVAALIDGLVPPDRAARGDDANTLLASNNWAVSPGRSATGAALLAGDPHLDLTLPSIWYEAHLVVPDSLDVYGVTIPGAPGIVIGFNHDVAWTFTNTGADALDFYRETVDDAQHPTRYRVDGAWRPLEQRAEVYRGRDGGTILTDTVRFTHCGPLSRQGNTWVSMRWTVLEPSHETAALIGAAHARTARELLDTVAAGFFAPAQNIMAVDRGGTIAVRSTGHFPIRPDSGEGLTIRDGSLSANDWRGMWPVSRYPQAFNPPQGFLASANQQPIDPRKDPGYLGDDNTFYPWRAMQINKLLRANSKVSAEDMRAYQTDPGSVRADLFTERFLESARAVLAKGTPAARLDTATALLAGWDRRYTRENERAVLFEMAMRLLADRTWDELTPAGGARVATPSLDVLLSLLSQPENVWWDDQRTAQHETRDSIVASSLAAAYDSVVARYGPSTGGAWRWDKIAPASANHLLHLRGFSALDLPVQGGPGTLNPSAGTGGFGSSWRMVVQMGPQLKAWVTYPGGQSGNPASDRYLDRLFLWEAGILDAAMLPLVPDSLPGILTLSTLRLSPASTVP